jgi:hypothetical protein
MVMLNAKPTNAKTHCNGHNGRRKRGRPSKRWREEVEEHLNIIGIRKQDGSGQRPSVMEEDCTGSQRTQRTAALGKEEKKKKQHYAFAGVYLICI